MPTYISQPASSRQLSSDITEPKARAAVMQLESARLTLRIAARIRARVSTACLYVKEKKEERKKERILFPLDSRIFFFFSHKWNFNSPLFDLVSGVKVTARYWNRVYGNLVAEFLSSKRWKDVSKPMFVIYLYITYEYRRKCEKEKYVLLVYLYSSLCMEF